MARDAFFCYDTISRGTVRRILKKYGFFHEMLRNSHFEEEKQVFALKMVFKYIQKAFLLLAECCFY